MFISGGVPMASACLAHPEGIGAHSQAPGRKERASGHLCPWNDLAHLGAYPAVMPCPESNPLPHIFRHLRITDSCPEWGTKTPMETESPGPSMAAANASRDPAADLTLGPRGPDFTYCREAGCLR